MQVALIEYARNVANMKGAHSTEFNSNSDYPVVALITEWIDSDGQIEKRTHSSDLGGTMRLGAQVCHLVDGSKALEVYGKKTIRERHRHRFEVNNNFLPQLEKSGLVISGFLKTKHY